MSEYKDIFLSELEENIQLLNTSLIGIEKDNKDSALLKDLARAAHTIKGMAGTMGFDQLTKLTHEMENHLMGSRSITKAMIQTLFKSADRLQEFYDAVNTDKDPEKINVSDLVKQLKSGGDPSVVRKTEKKPTTVTKAVSTRPTDDIGIKVGTTYKLVMKFRKNARLIGTRGFQALRIIDSIAQINSSDPAVEILDDGKLVGDINMELISYETEIDMRQALGAVEDVDELTITRLMDDSAALVQPTGLGPRRTLQSVRVNLERLDSVIDLLGELVITRGRFQSLIQKLTPEMTEQLQIFDNTITTIQDTVMGFRMVSISNILDTYPRAVRDIAHSRGMEIELILQGTHIQIDRSVIDQVNEALLHILRNAAIHGIENTADRTKAGKSAEGRIRVAARRERGEVIIEVEDDGRGLDIAAIKKKAIEMDIIKSSTLMTRSQLAAIIFSPGFSTASEVTEVAGRGIGMDIVKATLDEIGGSIEIRTIDGQGTKFIIRVQQTLAIIEGLIVQVGKTDFAIPLLNVEKIFSINDPAVEKQGENLVLNWEGHNVRIINLKEVMGSFVIDNVEASDGNGNSGNKVNGGRQLKTREKVILWERAGKRVGLLVTNVVTQREIVTKQLDSVYREVEGFLGATILGYDQVALIIDPDTIEKIN